MIRVRVRQLVYTGLIIRYMNNKSLRDVLSASISSGEIENSREKTEANEVVYFSIAGLDPLTALTLSMHSGLQYPTFNELRQY